MGTLELTAQNFEETVGKGGIVFIDFWASWCGPCRAFAPVYEEAATKNPDITFGKVNTEEQRDLAGGFQIRAIPTLMIFRDGILLFAEPGALPGAALEGLITQIRALDMDDIRKKIADEKSKSEPAPES